MNRRDVVKSAGAFGMIAAVPVVTEPAPIAALPSPVAKAERKYMSHTAIEAALTFMHGAMEDDSLSPAERMEAASRLAYLGLEVEERILLRETLVYTVEE